MLPISGLIMDGTAVRATGLIMPEDLNTPEIRRKDAIAKAKIAKLRAKNRDTVPDSYDSTAEG